LTEAEPERAPTVAGVTLQVDDAWAAPSERVMAATREARLRAGARARRPAEAPTKEETDAMVASDEPWEGRGLGARGRAASAG